MATAIKILCFAGTLRESALNKKFARAAAQLVTAAGAESTFLDLRDYPLPLYDGDLEAKAGLPEPARQLKVLLKNHQGLIVAAGEYNGSITGVLKNMIDWTSRKEGDEPSKAAYAGKVGLLLSAAPGAQGGLRALAHVRTILNNLGVMLLPGQQALPRAQDAFAVDGSLKDPATQTTLAGHVARLVKVVAQLQG